MQCSKCILLTNCSFVNDLFFLGQNYPIFYSIKEHANSILMFHLYSNYNVHFVPFAWIHSNTTQKKTHERIINAVHSDGCKLKQNKPCQCHYDEEGEKYLHAFLFRKQKPQCNVKQMFNIKVFSPHLWNHVVLNLYFTDIAPKRYLPSYRNAFLVA